MPWDGLSLGPMDAVGIRGGIAHLDGALTTLQTQGSTQVQGPRVEVRPLLLLVCLNISG